MIFSVASGVKTEKGASNTFQAYQASVSDAWDIEVSGAVYCSVAVIYLDDEKEF